jgi:hypothetical protein
MKNVKKLYEKIKIFIGKKQLLRIFVQYIYSLLRFRVSYSQCGEDLIILDYLNSKKIIKGKYLDIGAFHPIFISNTYLLHKNNFSGFIVDMDEEKLINFKLLRGNNVKVILSAITNKYDKIISFYKFNKKILPSEYDSTSLEFAEYIKKKHNINFTETIVKNTHINDLFKEVGDVDFLNLDLEGVEKECLFSADLSLIKPKLITIKYRNINKIYDDDINSFFKKNNYRFLFKASLFLGYAKSE